MRKILVLLFFVAASIISAQAQNFTLVNGTDFAIYEVYVSPSESEHWGDDILTVDVLISEDQVDVLFEGHDDCLWDIKAVAEDGSEAVWTGIDLCEYYLITLTMTDDGPYAIME